MLQRGLRYLIPLLLCLLFLLLSFLSPREEQAAASGRENVPPPAVPFTRQAAENYLALSGFALKTDGTLLYAATIPAGTLRLEEGEGGILRSLSYEMECVGDLAGLENTPNYQRYLTAAEQDKTIVKGVYRALFSALEASVSMRSTQKSTSEKKLLSCLEKERTAAYTGGGWAFSFASTDKGYIRTLTFSMAPEG